MNFITDAHIYRTSSLIRWPRKLEFAFAAIEFWLKSKWNLAAHWLKCVIYKRIARSKMKEFENYLELSKLLYQTWLSVNHSASYDLQMKRWPNNASGRVLCHHICEPRIEKANCWNRYLNSQPIVNQFWIPEGRKTREKAVSQIFFQCGFQDAS